MAVVMPVRPNWDLDDPDFAPEPSDDDYEFEDPDAIPLPPAPDEPDEEEDRCRS